jgi:hypothetical protein
MRTLLKSTFLPLVALWLLSPMSASAWTWDNTCEGGTVGSLVSSASLTGFTDPFSLTDYSNVQAATGKQSCKMGITSGSDGWGIWGGTITFPSVIANGGQIWARVSLFVPAGFNLTASDGILKFMRIHTATSGGTNVGYHDLLIANSGAQEYNAAGKMLSSPAYVYNFEGIPNLQPVGTQSSNALAFGKWETYEMYVKFDTVAKANGGTGEVRVWKNNQLLLDFTSQATLVSSTDHADGFFVFTYWNGNAPATQSLYTDDIIATSDTPSNKDSAGNACLCGPTPGGAATSTGSSAPTSPTTPDPPTNVSVQ